MYKLIILCLLAGCAAPSYVDPKPLIGYDNSGETRQLPFAAHRNYDQFTEKVKSDLTRWLPKYEDQGDINSCTAFSVANVIEGLYKHKYDRFLSSSKLFLYYNAREDKLRDDGVNIDDAIESAMNKGITTTYYWPYIRENLKIKPSPVSYSSALNYRINKAYKVDHKDITKALSNGYPVIVGCSIYQQFDSLDKDNYIMTLPNKKEKNIGFHAMIIVGHNNKSQLYLVNNSWGRDWGLNGTCYVPYEYIHNIKLTKTCWILDYVE